MIKLQKEEIGLQGKPEIVTREIEDTNLHALRRLTEMGWTVVE
jgi:hypothetical protein